MGISDTRPAGYAFLIEKYNLKVIPNWHTSFIGHAGGIRTIDRDGQRETIYPLQYWPGEGIGDHLEFAISYDGTNLGILSALFEKASENEIASYISSKPTGKNARRIWFLYEYLTGRSLPLEDLGKMNYVDALDADLYYTIESGEKVRRQKVVNNLLGSREFCPIIRRTKKLLSDESIDLPGLCQNIVSAYPPELLKRALNYLFGKETKSSFEIENIKPSASRTEIFISLLELAGYEDFCEKQLLIDIQNRIVDQRFVSTDYRTSQNYIGQSISLQRQLIHYICPKPADLKSLMDGLIASHKRMKASTVHAIAHAAVISFGFVFIHPFEDGNGRIHRFLIHNILSLRGVVPKGLMFPVSAAMLKNRQLYDSSLETFSKPLMKLVSYEIDDLGRMSVLGDTARMYRFIDLTTQAEALFDFVKLTIEHELTEELEFLSSYDETRKAIQEIVDMPDRQIDLFIRLCLQENGKLSARKRESHFSNLTDAEIVLMQEAVTRGYKRLN